MIIICLGALAFGGILWLRKSWLIATWCVSVFVTLTSLFATPLLANRFAEPIQFQWNPIHINRVLWIRFRNRAFLPIYLGTQGIREEKGGMTGQL